MKYFSSQHGISLVELLIATTLGLFLISSLFVVYLGNKKTYQLNEALAHMQENGRIALLHLAHDIRMANKINFDQNKNSLIIKESEPDYVDVLNINDEKNEITVNGKTNFKSGDVVQINSYQESELVKINTINKNKIMLASPLQNNINHYRNFAEISHVANWSYFVADTGRKNRAGDPIFALYRSDENQTNLPSELVEGIEQMQILPQTNGSKITSVKIALLLGSIETVNTQPQPYTFLGNTYTPSDRRLHREWDMVVALRERV